MPTEFPEIPAVPSVLLPIFRVIWGGFLAYWWLVVPPALFFIFAELWLVYVQMRFIRNIEWKTLEISVPKEILKTPKAMEQVFAGLAAIQKGANFVEKWWEGKVQPWVSFEIAGGQGAFRLFAHIPEAYKNLVEAQIFAQYPEAEIREVDDYTLNAPEQIPSRDYSLWGTELVFEKDPAYPLRMYFEFEEAQEEKRLDPIATFAEAVTHLGSGEGLWIQFLLKPASKTWKEKGQELVNKLIGKKTPKKPLSFFQFIVAFVGDFVTGFVHAALNIEPPEATAEAPKKEEGPETKMSSLSPGEKTVVEAVEKKLAKFGFSCGIRFVYWGRRDAFTMANVSSVLSYFRQFNTLNMNALKPNKRVTPSIDYFFKARREFLRKMALWQNYKMRAFPLRDAPVLNTEELATLYHFPTMFVEAPTVYRIESKKGGAPPTLPIEE